MGRVGGRTLLSAAFAFGVLESASPATAESTARKSPAAATAKA
jgi:hypothetical protein